MPVHGEYRHLLQHARLAESVGIPAERIFLVEDGLGLEMTQGRRARPRRAIPPARVLVDGKVVGDVGAVVLRDRQLLSEAGMVIVALTVDATTGPSSRDPRSPLAGSST